MLQSCLHKTKKTRSQVEDQISKNQNIRGLATCLPGQQFLVKSSRQTWEGLDYWTQGATTTDVTDGMPGNLSFCIILFWLILLPIKELQTVYKQLKAQINYLLANTYNTASQAVYKLICHHSQTPVETSLAMQTPSVVGNLQYSWNTWCSWVIIFSSWILQLSHILPLVFHDFAESQSSFSQSGFHGSLSHRNISLWQKHYWNMLQKSTTFQEA